MDCSGFGRADNVPLYCVLQRIKDSCEQLPVLGGPPGGGAKKAGGGKRYLRLIGMVLIQENLTN